jgi:hypothetical protein
MESRKPSNIFIYGRMSPQEAEIVLKTRARDMIAESGSTHLLDQERLWLLRESREPGLLTLESILYDKENDIWLGWSDMNEKTAIKDDACSIYRRRNEAGIITEFFVNPQRYMLSFNKGWIVNNYPPNSYEFYQFAEAAGGKIQDMDKNSNGEDVVNLLEILCENGCYLRNRINPREGEQIKVQGYARYTLAGVNNAKQKFSLPLELALTLACHLSKEKGQDLTLMKEPVILKSDGISYEREILLMIKPELKEGRDFYENLVLKNIIGYLSTQDSNEKYLEYLNKINDYEILDTFTLSKLQEPVVTPAGHTYEKNDFELYIDSSIDSKKNSYGVHAVAKDPKNTSVLVTKNDLVLNRNLQSFIAAWPEFYSRLNKEAVEQTQAKKL